MLFFLENSMLLVWAIVTFSIPIILIVPIIFATDSYD